MMMQGQRGLESQLVQTLASAATSFTAASADLVAAAALFQELLPGFTAGNGNGNSPLQDDTYLVGGVASALSVFQRALEAVPEEVCTTMHSCSVVNIEHC